MRKHVRLIYVLLLLAVLLTVCAVPVNLSAKAKFDYYPGIMGMGKFGPTCGCPHFPFWCGCAVHR